MRVILWGKINQDMIRRKNKINMVKNAIFMIILLVVGIVAILGMTYPYAKETDTIVLNKNIMI